MALKAKRIYVSIYPSIYLEVNCLSVCQSVSQYKCYFKRHANYDIGFIYFSGCLNALFYRLSHIHSPHPPQKIKNKIKNKIILEYIHLSVWLCVCLTICLSTPVCMSQRLSVCPLVSLFSVCVRKQVSITWKFPTHFEDETQNKHSHTTVKLHSKLSNQFSASFPQQNDFKTTCIKSL